MRDLIHFTTYLPLQHHCPLMVHSKQQIKHRKQYNTIDNPENKQPISYSHQHLQTKINTHMPSAKLPLVFLFHELVFLILQQSVFVGFLIPRLVRLSYSPASSSFHHNRSYLSSQICVISKCTNVRWCAAAISSSFDMKVCCVEADPYQGISYAIIR